MIWIDVVFWLSAACVAYTYVGYPLLLLAVRRRRPASPPSGQLPTTISIVMAARNEEAVIGPRIQHLLERIELANVEGEIIVVSDGSSDATVAQARAVANERVRVLELASPAGKAAAVNAGCAAASGQIVVLVDVRQPLAPTALPRLLENFADPAVGAVSGDLVLESGPGVLAGVGLYWRYEKWLRQLESRVHSVVGATGAISAVRRELFRTIPVGTLLDDVYWPLQVAMQGFRVLHEASAKAYDRLPDRASGEFTRKVRTLSGNYQLATLLPSAVLPWRNPIWLQFISHKLLRLVVPWALLAMLASSAMLRQPAYVALFWAQIAFYALGTGGMVARMPGCGRIVAAASSFLLLNAAAWVAFWVWITGNVGQSWRKVLYTAPTEGLAQASLLIEATRKVIDS